MKELYPLNRGKSTPGKPPAGGGEPERSGGLASTRTGGPEARPLGIGAISVTRTDNPERCKVRICPHGTIISEGGHLRSKPPQSGANRGVIHEWSKKSRARLRRLLAEADGPEGWEPLGMTGTIPGNVISEAEFRRLWQTFRRECPAVPVIWRVELQKRKQPHVHMVVWVPPAEKGQSEIRLMQAWERAVRRLGKVEWTGKDGTVFQSSRMAMPGADRHAVQFDELQPGDDFGWWRYLASHQGKSKQDQLGWKGRNWGVLNGDKLRRESGERYGLSRSQWLKMRRWLRRLTRYRGAGAGCKSVWYVRPDTMRTLVELAHLS